MAYMTYEEFIDEVIQEQLEKLIMTDGYHYMGFMLMVIAIEFLGIFLEQSDIEEKGKSEGRFNKGLRFLGIRYTNYANKRNPHYLYRHLRGGLVHQFRPLTSVSLTNRKEAKELGIKHLEIYATPKILVLVAEDMYEDIQTAFNKLKSSKRKGHCQRNIKKAFITIPDKGVNSTQTPSLSGGYDSKQGQNNKPYKFGTSADS